MNDILKYLFMSISAKISERLHNDFDNNCVNFLSTPRTSCPDFVLLNSSMNDGSADTKKDQKNGSAASDQISRVRHNARVDEELVKLMISCMVRPFCRGYPGRELLVLFKEKATSTERLYNTPALATKPTS